MRNVSAPFGVSDPSRPIDLATIWRTITALIHGVLDFDNVNSPRILWINLKALNFAPDKPVRKLNLVDHPELSGEVSAKFQPAKMFRLLPPN